LSEVWVEKTLRYTSPPFALRWIPSPSDCLRVRKGYEGPLLPMLSRFFWEIWLFTGMLSSHLSARVG